MEEIVERTQKINRAQPVFENGLRTANNSKIQWSKSQLFLFRVSFVFFLIMSIPTNPEWYNRTFALDWFHPNYRDIYDLARFLPDVPGLKDYSKGFWSYNDWFVILGISLVGGLIWSALDRTRTEYNRLYYWLRVIIRYRAGIGMVGFGMQKVFPVQMAYPPLSILNTSFGDLTMQKLYWWEIGISPFYQVFTGFVEVGSGLLLFNRKTVFFGAVLLVAALGAVNYVNIAYDGNVHVYSTYFVLYGLFLILYYAYDIYNLQFKEQYTIPKNYDPSFRSKGWKFTRIGLKTANFLIFILLLTWLQYLNFIYDPYNQPSTPAVKNLRGYYNVSSFTVNGKSLAFSPLDPVRWQNVAFEKWSSMSIKVNMPIPSDISGRMSDPAVRKFVGNNGFNFNSGAPVRDIDRTLEIFAANQRTFYYRADTVNQILYLQDKATGVSEKNKRRWISAESKDVLYKSDWINNDAQINMFTEIDGIDKRGQSTRRTRAYKKVVPLDSLRDRMKLHYDVFSQGRRVELSGINDKGDSIRVVLDRIDKKYLLPESKLQAGKYEY